MVSYELVHGWELSVNEITAGSSVLISSGLHTIAVVMPIYNHFPWVKSQLQVKRNSADLSGFDDRFCSYLALHIELGSRVQLANTWSRRSWTLYLVKSVSTWIIETAWMHGQWSELAAYDPLPDTYQFLLPLPPATLNDVQFPRYRLAFKFRKLQKSFLCKLSISAVLVLAKY